MKLINAVKSRRLVPPAVVAVILAAAYMAPLPTQASQQNNCGVKAGYGYAFHDHGKPCPNRPFPGKGKGIANFPAVSSGTSAPQSTSGPSSDVADNRSLSNGNSSSSNGHGHGKSHGQGRGHRSS